MAKEKEQNKNNINRRHFFKLLGGGAVATSALLTACNSKQTEQRGGTTLADVPTDKMTYRTSSATGDVVSILGYGCMRLPTKPSEIGRAHV